MDRMIGYAGTAAPPAMYVRALYNYEADDPTSLSFRQGDVIQVITQLESGWWDGVINGVRGWFPSNYCAVIPGPVGDELEEQHHVNGDVDDADVEDEFKDDFDGDIDDLDSEGNLRDDAAQLPIEGLDGNEHEAAFWIPQATPDGRLFYFNTLTGVSTMELPLENPTSPSETGPRERTLVYIPESTRPPPEMMAGGLYEHDEDDADYTSASDAEPLSAVEESRGSLPFRRRSNADGVSPATSMDSMNQSSPTRRQALELNDLSNGNYSMMQSTMPPNGTTATSFAVNPLGPQAPPAIARQYFDDLNSVPLTWNKLVDDMTRSIDRYRQAIHNADRSEFVRRAEDISDNLRLILAAGSGTTDNHSGNPSIISTNKALYPHFRETMSRFSKLVLSSHIAAADFPPPDSYAKCLKEADGVLNGIYGFVEVARQQRGEEIPRLIPGFVSGSNVGGGWRNNGLTKNERSPSLPFLDQDEYDAVQEPTARLDAALLDRLRESNLMVESGIKRLNGQLKLQDKIVTPLRHRMIGDAVCKAASRIVELSRPLLSTVESVNLSEFASEHPTPQLQDFVIQKQRLYDLMSDLVISCQAVAAPLGDEWSELRSESLEERMLTVGVISREIVDCTSQLLSVLEAISRMMPSDSSEKESRLRSLSNPDRPQINDLPLTNGSTPNLPGPYSVGDHPKVRKLLGIPAPQLPLQPVEEVPEYLRLDHEREITYDTKSTPPQLKGGTLAGLVEQLTRHDRLDSPFNNTFLLTYRSFTTAAELFEMLVQRWKIQPPYGLSKEDYQVWVEKKQKLIRFRVVNILKSWFDTYWMEGSGEDAKQLMMRVYNFAKEHVATTNTPGAAPLIAAVEQRMRGQDGPKRLVLTLNTQTPQPILPKNMKKLKFLDIDALEFARQLTIIESKLYIKIKPTECLNKTWQRKVAPNEPDPAANIKALILQSNQLTNWVVDMILTQQDVKRRVVVIKHFVSVADKCRQLNNFSTLTSIISALGTAPIHRLTRTWQQVNGRTKDTLESMRKLMASTKNFAEYRDTLHKANPPCVPFLGVYLTDLTFIEDGIPSVIRKSNLINFAKRAKTAEVIGDIQINQNVPYPLQPVPELQEYILSNMRTAGDVHEMYELSLQVEPREREDDRIARLLSESGFL